jgi:glucose/arabinose dehydrogenase
MAPPAKCAPTAAHWRIEAVMNRRTQYLSWRRGGTAVAICILAATARAQIAPASEYGPHPELPPPENSWLPTLKIPKNVGWPQGGGPAAAAGLSVNALATHLRHPRMLYVLPNGDVLVAESEQPAQTGFGATLEKWVMNFEGAPLLPSANRITLLRPSADGSGAEPHVLLQGLNSPFGMALIGHDLYIGDNDAVLKFPYSEGATEIRASPVKITSLPSTPVGHWTRNLLASADGSKLYVGVGSSSNVADDGMAAEAERAAIWEIDLATGQHRVYASGLRNPVGMAWEPDSGALWTAVNERDDLGDHLPPDYMTSVHEGAFYGWPFSYYGQHVDGRVKPQDPAKVASALPPDYALGAHTASLGLCWSGANALPQSFQRGMFVGQHGSWNRSIRSGYKVVFVAFDHGHPTGMPIDVLTGFLNAQQQAQGRPVGVAIDHQGALLVADDVGNTVWRVTAARATP